MVCTNIVIVLFLSLFAYMCDLRDGKVPNGLILWGYAGGFIYAICEKGASGILEAIISLVWPILLLYVLFRIRALGAGDIKLISVISLFLNGHQVINIIYLSFLIGAGFGAIRLVRHRQIIAHLYMFSDYIQSVIREKRPIHYHGSDDGLGRIHFCGCIFAACAIVLTGITERGVNGIFQYIGM